MKKLTLLFSSFLVAFSLFSQPTLTSSINLSIGDTYRYDGYSEVTNIEPGPGGADLTWDFSGITGVTYYEGIPAVCVNPSTTPFADSAAVANANICTSPVDGIGPFQYYDNDNSSQNLIAMGFMAESGNSFSTYTDIFTALEFPFTYNDSFDDTWELVSFNFNGSYHNKRDSSYMTVEADAYGTITTPLGEFTNVLRVKRTTTDHSWMKFEAGGDWMYFGSFTDIEYSWFAPNIKTPVMFITEMDGFPSYEARYIVEYNFQVGIEEQSDIQLDIFPNPTTNMVTIKTDKTINRVSVFSLNGRQMGTSSSLTSSSHQQTIDVSNYPKGVYLIKVGFENGSIVTERIIKQ